MSVPAVGDDTSKHTVKEKAQPVSNPSPSRRFDRKTARKRKHEQVDQSSEIWPSYNVQVTLPCLDGQKGSLMPRFLISRSSLPLAYLDPVVDGDASFSSRLLATQIEPLEDKDNGCQQPQPQVLIAQNESCGRFYAIEKVHKGLYAICRLGQWVPEDAFRKLYEAGCAHDPPPQAKYSDEDESPASDWWRSAMAPPHIFSHVPNYDPNAIIRARDFKLSLKRSSRNDVDPITIKGAHSEANPKNKTASGMVQTKTQIVETSSQKPEDSLKTIKVQYQDALYLSRASLAYFAKGPLSRARANFQSPNGSADCCLKLTEFLRTMILDLHVMDKKYRETLPNLVKDFPFASLSDGESASVIETVQKTSRKSKKDKVSRNGLYAGEDVIIARWWLGRDVSGVSCDSNDAREESRKRTILEQRAREAQLQIIILLETLALEATTVVCGENSADVDNVDQEQGEYTAKAKKSRKPQDLHTLLDLLADRLCIWQSMSMEVEEPSANEQVQSLGFQKKVDKLGDDYLRQFCIDVIIPFYCARLPEVSTLLCQKLGGPKDPSPKRPQNIDCQAMSKVAARPGAPIPHPKSRRARRTLERVLTDDKARHKSQKPLLSRSATEPLLQVKREVSDTTLSSIPLNKVAMSKRYTQREVDLRAASQATEAKHKKKSAIQQELQGAIAAIKRPNPKLAGKEFVEAVEKRQARSHPKKTTKLVRNPFTQDLQVMATPSKNQSNGPYKFPRLPQTLDSTMSSEMNDIPPSSVSQMILSSTRKPSGTHYSGDKSADPGNQRHLALVDQTPTKGPARFINRSPTSAAEDTFVASSQPRSCWPTAWDVEAQETPSKRNRGHSPLLPRPTSNYHAAPYKPIPAQVPTISAPSPPSQVEEPDLYTSLGWNYEIDD